MSAKFSPLDQVDVQIQILNVRVLNGYIWKRRLGVGLILNSRVNLFHRSNTALALTLRVAATIRSLSGTLFWRNVAILIMFSFLSRFGWLDICNRWSWPIDKATFELSRWLALYHRVTLIGLLGGENPIRIVCSRMAVFRPCSLQGTIFHQDCLLLLVLQGWEEFFVKEQQNILIWHQKLDNFLFISWSILVKFRRHIWFIRSLLIRIKWFSTCCAPYSIRIILLDRVSYLVYPSSMDVFPDLVHTLNEEIF